MAKIGVGAVLIGVALVGVTATSVGPQDFVVHQFECPNGVSASTDYVRHIGSDPTFSLQGNKPLNNTFRSSWQAGQEVGCTYQWAGYYFSYSYTVKRTIVHCHPPYGLQPGSGRRIFKCLLKP